MSQGALFRYYPTKAALLAASVEHLFSGLREDFRRDFAALATDERDRCDAGFDLLWRIYTGPRLIAAFELYMAARTDQDLARALHPVVGAHRAELLRHAVELFPEAARDRAAFSGTIDLLMCAMEGVAIERYGAGPDTGGPALERLRTVARAALRPPEE